MKKVPARPAPELRYPLQAYKFLLASLQFTQEKLGRTPTRESSEAECHISGQELCEGIRQFACENFGMLTLTVFREWGIAVTGDFGRMVYELIERGEMRKTDRDQLSDFFDVYDFQDAFMRQYRVDVSGCFRESSVISHAG